MERSVSVRDLPAAARGQAKTPWASLPQARIAERGGASTASPGPIQGGGRRTSLLPRGEFRFDLVSWMTALSGPFLLRVLRGVQVRGGGVGAINGVAQGSGKGRSL